MQLLVNDAKLLNLQLLNLRKCIYSCLELPCQILAAVFCHAIALLEKTLIDIRQVNMNLKPLYLNLILFKLQTVKRNFLIILGIG